MKHEDQTLDHGTQVDLLTVADQALRFFGSLLFGVPALLLGLLWLAERLEGRAPPVDVPWTVLYVAVVTGLRFHAARVGILIWALSLPKDDKRRRDA